MQISYQQLQQETCHKKKDGIWRNFDISQDDSQHRPLVLPSLPKGSENNLAYTLHGSTALCKSMVNLINGLLWDMRMQQMFGA